FMLHVFILNISFSIVIFFNDTATTEIYTLSLHDALPILNGMRGKTGFFFRTPKHGPEIIGNEHYHRDIRLDRIAIAEGILASAALTLSIPVLLDGVWALALTLRGFGVLTLKSMNLSRILAPK